MRIVLISASYAPRVGGLETVVKNLALELKQRGHDVYIIANRYPRSLRRYELIDDVPIHRILMTNVVPSREQLPRLPKYVVGVLIAPLQLGRLVKLIRRLQPDLINVHYLGLAALYAALAKRFHSAPMVLSLHGSDLTTVPYPPGYVLLSRFAVKQAQALTTCSNDLCGYLRNMMPEHWQEPVTVTGNGVNASELESVEPLRTDRPYLFSAARLASTKGLDVLVRAFSQVRASGQDLDLIVAGSGPEEERLRLLARDLRVDDHIRFWGTADRRQMAALMRGCDIFILPSLREGFGIASLEAMVLSKPVVASRCGGIPEVVRHRETGLLVTPGDADALSKAILVLANQPELRAAYGKRGRDLAINEFSWRSVANRYLEAYEGALQNTGTPNGKGYS